MANRVRCEASFHPLNAWSPSDWALAACGELGEAANLIKKARRAEGKTEEELGDHDLGLDFPYDLEDPDAPDRRRITGAECIGWELADAVIYIDLLAQRLGLDLAAMVAEKFNVVSRRVGSTVMLDETEATA